MSTSSACRRATFGRCSLFGSRGRLLHTLVGPSLGISTFSVMGASFLATGFILGVLFFGSWVLLFDGIQIPQDGGWRQKSSR